MGLILGIGLVLMFVIGMPVALSLGGAASLSMLLSGEIDLLIVPQRLMLSINVNTLMAIPLFILSGNLMSNGGMSRRIVDFAMSLLSKRAGGLALVSILACMFFAALSGSGSATAAAIGGIMIPEMIRYKYERGFAAATVACSAELGVIIPPSTTMILYGVATGTSVSAMFIAGIIPGIMIGITLLFVAYFMSKKRGYKGIGDESKIPALKAFKNSFFALLMPVIILGGIYGGIFTCTEAATVAAFYALFCGTVIYRELNGKLLLEAIKNTLQQATMVLLIIGNASLFGYILGVERIPDMVANAFVTITDNPIVFLLLVNLLLFVVGMIFESSPAIHILAPILAPLAAQYGIDPVHFGIIMIVNLAVGMVTPPVGLNLYVSCSIANLKIEQLVSKIVPYLICLVVDVFIISYVPIISTFLPGVLGY